jgi:hypothetical protein
MELNEHLRQMLKELGQAINESISGSGKVHESIQRIRDEGYNLYMVLDAKVGVNRRNGSRKRLGTAAAAPEAQPARSGERAEFRINVKDLRFLKSVGIDPTRKVRVRTSPLRRARRPVRAAAGRSVRAE